MRYHDLPCSTKQSGYKSARQENKRNGRDDAHIGAIAVIQLVIALLKDGVNLVVHK